MDETMKKRMLRRGVLVASIPACLTAVALYRVPVQEFLAYWHWTDDTTIQGRKESSFFSHADMFADRALYPGERNGKKLPLRQVPGKRSENISGKSGI